MSFNDIVCIVAGLFVIKFATWCYGAFFKKKKKYKTLAHYALDGKKILNERPAGMSMKDYREQRAEQTRVLRGCLKKNGHHNLYCNEHVEFE